MIDGRFDGHTSTMLPTVTDEALLYVLHELADADSPAALVRTLLERHDLAAILWRVTRGTGDPGHERRLLVR